MAKIRFYVDEHTPKAVIRGLRERGVDVLTVPDADMMGAQDQEHLTLARAEGRVIFTQDADFLRLAATGAEHVGIVYAPQHTAVGVTVRGLMLIYQVLDAEEMIGKIEYL